MSREMWRTGLRSRAFGALKRPVFGDNNLSLRTKRLVYRGVVMGVLLYVAETWAIKRADSRKLEVFHNRCLRAILGITTAQQRMGHISSVQVSQWFGMEESLEDLLSARRLRWLGHLARMKIVYPRRFCLDGYHNVALHMEGQSSKRHEEIPHRRR